VCCHVLQLAEEQELEKQAAVQAAERYRCAICLTGMQNKHYHLCLNAVKDSLGHVPALSCSCQPLRWC